ncbi:UNVERIFIED_CONTAM: haloacid dehalogenase-like hydrolase [Acetivibrio alkalicellulosi]
MKKLGLRIVGWKQAILIPLGGIKYMGKYKPLAVCFDFNGVIVDHRSKKTINGMEELIKDLHDNHVLLAIVSGSSSKIINRYLDKDLTTFFKRIFYSNKMNGGKIGCIKTFALEYGLDLVDIAFVDDKPINLKQLACSSAYVIGFARSGKYPTAQECYNLSIPVASSVEELSRLLLN